MIVETVLVVANLALSALGCTDNPAGNYTTCSVKYCFNSTLVDCNTRALSTCPTGLPVNTTELDLSRNMIESIDHSCRFDRFYLLQRLNLSHNQISKISGPVFKGLAALRVLDLRYNKLNISALNAVPRIFKLPGLTHLYLQHNSQSNTYPDKALEDLTALTTLVMDGLSDAVFGKGFANMTNLAHLTLSGFATRCNLSKIGNETLRNLQHVRTLNISNCNVREVDTGAFSTLTELQTLDLSYNIDLGFCRLYNVTYGLDRTKVETLDISMIHSTYGLGTQLKIVDVIFLQNTSLREIRANSNRLQYIESCLFRYMPKSLERISFEDNGFTYGQYLCETMYLASVKVVKLNFQYIAHDPDRHRVQNIQTNNLCSAVTTNLTEKQVIIPTPNGFLYLPRCRPMTYNEIFAKCSPFNATLPESLEELHFSRALNYIDVEIPPIEFNQKNKIKFVDLSHNGLWSWKGPLFNITNLSHLDLSQNGCFNVHPLFFTKLINLKTLKVNDNLLGFTINLDTTGTTFSSQEKLTYLDISNNRIQALPNTIFQHLQNLRMLNLSSNQMRQFTVDLTNLTHISCLDLSNNKLPELPDTVRHHLSSVARRTRLHVNLTANPLRCSCENLEFIKWLQHPSITYPDRDSYECTDRDGAVLSLHDLDALVQHLTKTCASYSLLIAITTLCIIAASGVIVLGLVYRFRWKLRYLLYTNWNKYRGYTPIPGEDRHRYTYDAFLSYADENGDFVRSQLLHQLEETDGLTVCLHERDFTPGNPVAANIAGAIEGSRKTVVVMSRDYLNSHWCMYELNMARMAATYSRAQNPFLIIIMLERVSTSDLPLEVIEVIDKNTYIRYPDDIDGAVVFWHNLKQSILGN